MKQYTVSGTGGMRGGKRFAVVESGTRRRVSFHRTFAQAQAEAKRLTKEGK